MRLTTLPLLFVFLLPASTLATGLDATSVDGPSDKAPEKTAPNIYGTFGVHNPPSYSPCKDFDCLNRRPRGAPSDPLFPTQWVSDWIMYTVHDGYQNSPPPYPLDIESVGITDYTMSQGTTFWRRGDDGVLSGTLSSHIPDKERLYLCLHLPW